MLSEIKQPVTGLIKLPIISTVDELQHAFEYCQASASQMLGPMISPITDHAEDPADAKEAGELFQFVIQRLLEENLLFPQPRTLAKAVELRHRRELEDFRQVFFTWLSALADGIPSKRVAREVRSAARAFRVFPRLEHLANLCTIGSLAVGSLEAAVGSIEAAVWPSLALKVVGLGAHKLAKRLKSRSSWLYLTTEAYSGGGVLNILR